MKGYGKMYSYRYKVTGFIIAGIGLSLWALHRVVELQLLRKFDYSQHSFLFWLIVVYGLVLAAFSVEKHDDERVKAIRAKSMMVSFGVTIGTLMAASFAFFIVSKAIDAAALIIIPSFSVIFYHLFFHFGLYNDKYWDFKDEPWKPFRQKGNWKQKSFIIFLFIAGLFTGYLIYETITGM